MRDYIPSILFDRSPSPDLSRALWDGVSSMPVRFGDAVWEKFGATDAGAIDYLTGAVKSLSGCALELSASDAEICSFAVERSNEVRSLLMSVGAMASDDMRNVMAGYCVEHGVIAPDKVLLSGLIARMTDAAWWRRQLRKGIARKVEEHAIGLGFVHRRAGLYASDDAVNRCGEQRERNRMALESVEATNEDGYTATLAQLSAVGVSNPVIRRGELMTRIAGFEAFAKGAGHVGMFYTATAPSRMHARLAASGEENPKYDGTTPKACAGYLSKTWAKSRAWLHRRGIYIYGFRVAEPHHDGTPHWHMLFFMIAEAVESVTACLRKYFCESDAHELSSEKAAAARFNCTKIDWSRGSAAGYISKYIAKNIDGLRNDLSAVGNDFEAEEPTAADKTAPRVLAWASTWGIRQFQQIGGPGVTVWRELRRLREAPAQLDFFDAWSATGDKEKGFPADWEKFVTAQGGIEIRRADRPVQLLKEVEEGKRTKYGEEAGPEIKGVFLNRPCLGASALKTRLHTWEISKKSERGQVAEAMPADVRRGAEKAKARVFRAAKRPRLLPLTLGAKRPWSPVNNCTQSKKDADGFALGEFEKFEPVGVSAGEVQKIKAAQVAAVLAGIAAKRKRGAFGQFPSLPAMWAGNGPIPVGISKPENQEV